jgi:hypothetical protein
MNDIMLKTSLIDYFGRGDILICVRGITDESRKMFMFLFLLILSFCLVHTCTQYTTWTLVVEKNIFIYFIYRKKAQRGCSIKIC